MEQRTLEELSKAIQRAIDELNLPKNATLADVINHCLDCKKSINTDWVDITRYGQIKVGDIISFESSHIPLIKQVEEVLYVGTEFEEILYNTINNNYFLTSNVLKGTSHAKNVKVKKLT